MLLPKTFSQAVVGIFLIIIFVGSKKKKKKWFQVCIRALQIGRTGEIGEMRDLEESKKMRSLQGGKFSSRPAW